MATLPLSSASRSLPSSICWIRALPKALSVPMRTWGPVKDTAGTSMAFSAMASRPMVTCSPVDRITSSSRGSGSSLISLASAISRLVSPLMAETTITSSCPSALNFLIFSATWVMRSTLPTEVPPNFWTISAICCTNPHAVIGCPICCVRPQGRPLKSLLLRHPVGRAVQRCVQGGNVGATTLRHVRATAALAADGLGSLANQIAGLDPAGQVAGDTGHQDHLAIQLATEQDDRRTQLVLQLIDQSQQTLAVDTVDALDQHPHAIDLAGFAGHVAAGGAGGPGLELLHFLLQLLGTLQRRRQLAEQVLPVATQQLRGLTQLILGLIHPGHGCRTGDRLDPAHPGSNTAFADDLEKTDVPGAADVGATAELDGEAASHGQHAHLVTIFLTEQGHGALGLGGLDIGHLDLHRRVGADLFVDQLLQLAQLLGTDGLEMTEVEAQALAVNQRALLLNVFAEYLAQGSVQQVVAEWLALVASRMLSSTTALTLVPTARLPLVTTPWCRWAPPALVVSRTSKRTPALLR